MTVARIIVHGGAWDIPDGEKAAHQGGCVAAAGTALALLEANASALDAVQAAVVYLEDDPTFDAGRGSFLNRDGIVELDAAIMNGRDLQAGAAACVTTVRNPVELARRIYESEHCLLVGPGAERFALSAGLEHCPQGWLVTDREQQRWEALRHELPETAQFFAGPRGTVGAVAIDHTGDIAAATSTGGTPFKTPGRVGDTPIIGSGCYADNELAGVSTTGWGEAFIRLVFSHRAAGLAGERPAPEACAQALSSLARLSAHGGLIMIDRAGNIGWASNTPAMAYAWASTDGRAGAGT